MTWPECTCQYTIRGVPESYAVLGENYTLQCTVTDSPGLVEFRRNNIVVCSIFSEFCESQPIDNRYKCGCINNNNKTLYLNISNINKQDDTTWSCRGDIDISISTSVPVYYGPENIRFNPSSDNIDVIEGKSQNVNCLADCNLDCNITWSKDGSTTILNNPLSLSTRDQTGSYTCTVTHTVLNKQLTKQLNVQIYYGPDELTFSPDIISINIIEDGPDKLTFSSNVTSINTIEDGPDRLTFSSDVTSINIIEDGPDKLTFSSDVTSINIIEDGPDKLTFSPDVTSINIIEDGPDKLTFSPDVTSINIIEGGDQTITCLTDCYECNYKWTGPVSSSTKDLVLTQIKRNQEGNYRCEATNIKNTNPKTRSKSIQVNVHYPPNITSITSDAVNNEADEGFDVKFNCSVDSKPVSTITWSSSTSTDTNTGQQWTLTQAKCQDTGIYTCTANNGIGQTTTKSLPLNIRFSSRLNDKEEFLSGSPRINGDLKDEVMNRLGEEVTLLIDVIAYPKPSFKWIRESTGQELTPDTTQQVATNNYISSLTVTIQQSSFDNYIVTVNNSIGDDKSYTIKIIDGDSSKPEPPSELNIPAVVGGIVAAVVVITIVIVAVIVIKKKIIPNEVYVSSDAVRTPHDNPAMEILENDLYVGSDAFFGKNPDVIPKVNTKDEEGGIFSQPVPQAEPVYGQVDKPKKTKANKKKEVPKKPPKPNKQPPVPGKIGEGNNNEGVYQNTGALGKEKRKNVEGLNYADVVFSNKKPTNKVQGKKEETVYVEIDPKKRGKPLPEEDSD
ncbi:hypothetical protein LOTGIDRAFT_239461 [Lottia gigantea]|uniref:Ig-like domain-containing protein n=1 Tax=Lottia gigantea TaxID=225164 RepID=V3ZUL7_LOTGI|nr:hypothetical protein LOTGIDRAFT_239461 [Lottia gigantea]ESO95183.1 hypothetical protein LOTGIDRAFT_239461 [Lottia gigantea]